jgi:hypothetical protein
MVMHELI